MIFHETKLAGAYLIDLDRRVDQRGFFARAFLREGVRVARAVLPDGAGEYCFALHPNLLIVDESRR